MPRCSLARVVSVIAAVSLSVLSGSADADPITYQGRLLDAGVGANGVYDMRFVLYTDADPAPPDVVVAGVIVSSVTVTQGLFTVELNFGEWFDGQPRWLQVDVRPAGVGGGYTPLLPRQRVGDVPVARLSRRALFAQELTLPFTQAGPPFSPSGGTFVITNTDPTGYAIGGGGEQFGVVGFGGEFSPYPPVIVPAGTVGIGEEVGVGGSSGAGSGVYGITTTGTGGEFTVLGPTEGVPLRAHTFGVGSAGIFERTGTTGAAPTVLATTNSRTLSAFAVHGIVEATSPGSSSAGVRGQNNGTGGNGIGVWGSQDGSGWGVYGTAVSGRGVFGAAFAAGGSGVYGSASGGALAGRFFGDVTVSGILTKGSGTFKIDHPLDPANKYLSHSFVESPDMKNIYDGVVNLADDGTAEVRLPDYFDALNDSFRYQLTCVGGHAPVYIAREIEDNAFVIAGGTAGLKVSWQVTGVRKDAFARTHRVIVEQDKPEHERGRYLHPVEHGMPVDMGIDAARPN